MPRDHVEFIQAQHLNWIDRPPGPGFEGIHCKVLSHDAGSGGCSLLLRYPAGWQRPAHFLTAAHEFMVLEGAIEWDGIGYGLDDYAWLPAGRAASGAASAAGAVVLTFFDRGPQLVAGRPPAGMPEPPAAIERLATHELPWTSADIDPDVQFLRLAHKVLRHDPLAGEKTLLLNSGAQTHPRGWAEAQLRHDCVEEMFLLGGDLIGERGTMYEGAYFWRPPGLWHGPFGSRRGSLSLIRLLEGRHGNEWSGAKHPFTLTPLHAPVLPAGHPAAGAAPWRPRGW